METFTIGFGNRWWVQVVRRNPLVRGSDRIEAVVLAIAVILTIVAIPLAGAVGTFVHEERTRLYADEGQTRHQVIAAATADGEIVSKLRSITFSAEAMWMDAGRSHSGVVSWPDQAKVSDRQYIWVDGEGEPAGPPSSPSRADSEAVVAALALWLGVAVASVALVYVVRHWLNRWRFAEWGREIKASRNSDDRRNHES
jgi:hypothetical protein